MSQRATRGGCDPLALCNPQTLPFRTSTGKGSSRRSQAKLTASLTAPELAESPVGSRSGVGIDAVTLVPPPADWPTRRQPPCSSRVRRIAARPCPALVAVAGAADAVVDDAEQQAVGGR